MKLNQKKCILLKMNSIQNVYYIDGEALPIADSAAYLGTCMTAKADPHAEVSSRIASTGQVLAKLDMFWKRAPVSTSWKLRVHDAVITSKLLYGLESASLTKADLARLDAFQFKALRRIMNVSHPYYSGITNIAVMQAANQRLVNSGSKETKMMSERLIDRQVKFMGRLIRANEGDITKTCTMTENGMRTAAGWRRVGRPKIKWYDNVMKECIRRLVSSNIIVADWERHMRLEEAIGIVVESAMERLL